MQTVTATYARTDENWTVRVSGLGRELDAEASGIISARDRADQLVDELASGGEQPTVVHLIEGSAVEFTSTYMAARLARAEGAGAPEQPGTTTGAAESAPATARPDAGTQESTTDAGHADDGSGANDPAGNGTNGTAANGTAANGTAVAADASTDDASGTDDTDGTDDASGTDENDTGEASSAPRSMPTRTVPRKELSRTPETAPEHSSGGASADADEPAYAHAAH